jgi:TetR/AcrR family transcriptional regulator, transcriptional repressor of bet genes
MMAVPKRVDHRLRRRQITDAVCRITVKGGLSAATFREVAAEAGVSVRLVQYYFGTKDELLLATQRHVAERATARTVRILESADDTARAGLRAVLGSFIPVDEPSRENMLMFVALHTAALVDPNLARHETREVPDALHRAVKNRLDDAGLRDGADADLEAAILVSLVPSLAQSVLDDTLTPDQAFQILDYALTRALDSSR